MLVFLIVFTAYILITQRQLYLSGMRSIEAQIWGKPLDAKAWKPSEFSKRKKIKIVWRKKHDTANKH